MQHFLRHIGITQSYLFLNTFVYPIFGQYTGAELLWLAQNTKSPIVTHRHALWNYVRERQDLRLIVAVGKAAKESVHTWIKSRGGACPTGAHDVSQCDASVIGPHTRIVGVVHPGAGGQGGSTSAIIADFKKALAKIDGWVADDTSWLPVDPGGARAQRQRSATAARRSRSAICPTASHGVSGRVERRAIARMRSAPSRCFPRMAATGDLPLHRQRRRQQRRVRAGSWRPGLRAAEAFVRGVRRRTRPPLARLMMGGDAGLAWPDFAALGATAHPSFGYGPIYRGRPTQARILVLADQESHDDLFMFRALTGDAGQRLQQFLHAMWDRQLRHPARAAG